MIQEFPEILSFDNFTVVPINVEASRITFELNISISYNGTLSCNEDCFHRKENQILTSCGIESLVSCVNLTVSS